MIGSCLWKPEMAALFWREERGIGVLQQNQLPASGLSTVLRRGFGEGS